MQIADPDLNLQGLMMKYFVLKPQGYGDPYAEASRQAMLAYADSIEGVNPELAEDLRAWVDRETEPSED